MPTYRGNAGNLLQHWVLCEIVAACQGGHERLGFVDAYSMAPFATERPKHDDTSSLFDAVAKSLPGQRSAFERTWLKLSTSEREYPNSAAFVAGTWRGRFAMYLCERDPETVRDLNRWAVVARRYPGCEGIEVAAGDWRNFLHGPLLPSSDLLFLSFDPFRFDRDPIGTNPGNMVPDDLDRIVAMLALSPTPAVVQLSTYSARKGNAQGEVRSLVASRLARAGLEEAACVRFDDNMMSLVFTRHIESRDLESLPDRFDRWVANIR